jgi:hypothetical protein
MSNTTDYLNPLLPTGLNRIRIPIVEATEASLKGYGCLVDRADKSLVEIVRWPATVQYESGPDRSCIGRKRSLRARASRFFPAEIVVAKAAIL